jgi:acyl-CoA thioesterase I
MSDPTILAFGDSLVAGYGLPRDHAFPAQLERRLRATLPQAAVLGAGVSGDTTADGLRRLPRVLARLQARPALAIVELGANDLLRGIPPERSRAGLDAILTEFAHCGIPALLATFAAPAILGPAARRYNGIYEELASRHGIPHHPFFPPGVMGASPYVLPDRLHPNAAGIDRIAEAFAPAVLQALAADRAAAA